MGEDINEIKNQNKYKGKDKTLNKGKSKIIDNNKGKGIMDKGKGIMDKGKGKAIFKGKDKETYYPAPNRPLPPLPFNQRPLPSLPFNERPLPTRPNSSRPPIVENVRSSTPESPYPPFTTPIRTMRGD